MNNTSVAYFQLTSDLTVLHYRQIQNYLKPKIV